MPKFATAADSLTTALAIVDSRLTNIDINEQLELYLELIQRRANIQQAIAASGGGSSSITTNTSIEYGAGAVTAKTQRVVVADFAIAPVGAHTTNSSLSSAVTLTQPSGASRILLQAFTQNVRFLFTETTNTTVPTASVGFRLLAGERIDLSVPTGCLLKVIEETASASIQYQWVI
jgi:hypothetical protein